MLERDLQKAIIKWCKQQGIICVKVDSTSTRGWPDLVVILPSGGVLFVELKTLSGRLSKLQEHTHNWIKGNNGKVYTVRSLDEFKRVVTGLSPKA